MHNAECDASHPRCIDELRKQFEKDERALTAPPSTSLVSVLSLFLFKKKNFFSLLLLKLKSDVTFYFEKISSSTEPNI